MWQTIFNFLQTVDKLESIYVGFPKLIPGDNISSNMDFSFSGVQAIMDRHAGTLQCLSLVYGDQTLSLADFGCENLRATSIAFPELTEFIDWPDPILYEKDVQSLARRVRKFRHLDCLQLVAPPRVLVRPFELERVTQYTSALLRQNKCHIKFLTVVLRDVDPIHKLGSNVYFHVSQDLDVYCHFNVEKGTVVSERRLQDKYSLANFGDTRELRYRSILQRKMDGWEMA